MAESLPAPTGNPLEDFKQRVLEKLRTDIGSLMPDEVLAGLVQQAVRDTFFLTESVPKPGRSSYSAEMIVRPSWFQEEVTRQVDPMLKSAIAAHVAQHAPMIQEAIKTALEENKLTIMMASVVGDRVRDGMVGAAMEFTQHLRNSGVLRGY